MIMNLLPRGPSLRRVGLGWICQETFVGESCPLTDPWGGVWWRCLPSQVRWERLHSLRPLRECDWCSSWASPDCGLSHAWECESSWWQQSRGLLLRSQCTALCCGNKRCMELWEVSAPALSPVLVLGPWDKMWKQWLWYHPQVVLKGIPLKSMVCQEKEMVGTCEY